MVAKAAVKQKESARRALRRDRRAGSDARRASDASRPEFICPQCGRVFTARPYQIRAGSGFCSRECYNASQARLSERQVLNLIESQMSFAEIGRILGISRERVRFIARRAGSDARRASDLRRPEMTCAQCGKVFKASLSEIERGRRFCSRECYRKSMREPGTPRVELVCEFCGKTYTRIAYQLRGPSRFCSKVCHGRWLAAQRPQKKAKKEQRPAQRPQKKAKIRASAEGYPSFLTVRRRQLLERVAAGETYEEVAQALGIKQQTVRNEMHRLMRRMGARNRAQAVGIAAQQGWIT
ncbi:MAG: hypothetical protein JRE40_03110 [Deltaproteobacteria bacterium]|nr:hypothetical protein [Deltaproteobacteria bacterium]